MAFYGFLDQPTPPFKSSAVPSASAAMKKIFSVIPTPPGPHPDHKKGKTIHLLHIDYVFKALGLLPLHHASEERSRFRRTLGVVLHVVGLTLLFGTWVSTSFQLGQATTHIYAISHQKTSDELGSKKLLQLMSDLVPVAINIRAAIVLTLFMWKRNRWIPLMNKFSNLLRRVFPPPDLEAMIIRWRRRAIFWGALLAATVIGIDIMSWAVPFAWNPKQMWTAPEAYAPLKIPAEFYQATVVWVIYLTFPFVISQLVYVSLMTLTFIMKDCMVHINQSVKREGLCMGKGVKDRLFETQEEEESPQIATRREEMERLVGLHTELLDVCNSVNEMYTLIFFFAYTLDLGVALGDIATMISTPKMPNLMWVFSAVRCAVFMGYCSILQIPEINFNVEASDLVDHLCQYMKQALPVVQTIQGIRLHVVIQTFCVKCKEQVAVINGGHIFFATRKLFLATYATGFSFAVLAHEFFGEMKRPTVGLAPEDNAAANGTSESASHGKE